MIARKPKPLVLGDRVRISGGHTIWTVSWHPEDGRLWRLTSENGAVRKFNRRYTDYLRRVNGVPIAPSTPVTHVTTRNGDEPLRLGDRVCYANYTGGAPSRVVWRVIYMDAYKVVIETPKRRRYVPWHLIENGLLVRPNNTPITIKRMSLTDE